MKLRPVLEVVRLEENRRWGTFGALRIDKQVFCATLEPADLENRQMVSSIPAQQYMIERHLSPRHGTTFKIQDVPDRSDVLFHPGNLFSNTAGCVLLGRDWGRLHEARGVTASGITFERFMAIMAGIDEAHLTIIEHY
jgi:hypothetical protein